MSSDSKTIDAINNDLRMLSALRAYQKIDTKSNIIYNDNIITTIRRSLNTFLGVNGSSRNDLLIYVENTFTRAFEMAKKYIHSGNEVDRNICNGMIANVNETLSSLETNVLSTYSTDKHFTVKLMGLISKMRDNLKSLQNKEFRTSILLSTPQVNVDILIVNPADITVIPQSPELSAAASSSVAIYKIETAEI